MTSIEQHVTYRRIVLSVLVAATAVGAAGSSPVLTTAIAHTHPAAPSSALVAEAPFLAENDAAMTKMMDGMAAKPTGDIDRDFVAMMVPHHQGAIDMAVAVLRYGHNERIKRLAQEIIVTQQQEIAAMRLAVGDALPTSQPSPTQPPIVTNPSNPHTLRSLP